MGTRLVEQKSTGVQSHVLISLPSPLFPSRAAARILPSILKWWGCIIFMRPTLSSESTHIGHLIVDISPIDAASIPLHPCHHHLWPTTISSARLAINYPAYGHALWEPRPPRLYCPVEVGDVGFIREGRFHRLFNALLSADHPSHKIGVPEHYESLIPSLSDYIVSSTLSPSHYCSAGITSPAFL